MSNLTPLLFFLFADVSDVRKIQLESSAEENKVAGEKNWWKSERQKIEFQKVSGIRIRGHLAMLPIL